MLQPKKTKYRKMHKGRIKGVAKSCNTLAFGDLGLVAIESGKITGQQIEAARVAMSRATKKGGQVWIRIFPDKPITKKPLEVRMGKGKGAVDHYVAVVKPGRVIYEMGGVSFVDAEEALLLARSKLPIKTKLITRAKDPWIIGKGVKVRAFIPPPPEKVEKPAAAGAVVAAPAPAPAEKPKGKGKKGE